MRRFLEAGRLNSPRGLKGELRFDCWCDSVEFLSGVERLYLDPGGRRYLTVKELRPSLSTIVFEGYEDRSSASVLTGRTVYFDRNDIALPEGTFYNDDLIGLPVRDIGTGAVIGKVTRVEEGAASFLYYVSGEKNYIIPAVDEFIVGTDPEKEITVRLIDGLEA